MRVVRVLYKRNLARCNFRAITICEIGRVPSPFASQGKSFAKFVCVLYDLYDFVPSPFAKIVRVLYACCTRTTREIWRAVIFVPSPFAKFGACHFRAITVCISGQIVKLDALFYEAHTVPKL
jgi:hypothetical protein